MSRISSFFILCLFFVPGEASAGPRRGYRWRNLGPRTVECARRLVDDVTGRVSRAVPPPPVLGDFGRRFEWSFGYFDVPPNLAQHWPARDRALFGRLGANAEPRQLRLVWRPREERLTLVLAMPDILDVPQRETVLRNDWQPALELALERFASGEPGARVTRSGDSNLFLAVTLRDGTRFAAFHRNGHRDTFVAGGPYGRALFYVLVTGRDDGATLPLPDYVALYEKVVAPMERIFNATRR